MRSGEPLRLRKPLQVGEDAPFGPGPDQAFAYLLEPPLRKFLQWIAVSKVHIERYPGAQNRKLSRHHSQNADVDCSSLCLLFLSQSGDCEHSMNVTKIYA